MEGRNGGFAGSGLGDGGYDQQSRSGPSAVCWGDDFDDGCGGGGWGCDE